MSEQLPTPEELAHAREVDALRERLEDYRREVERRDEYLRGADDEILGLKGQLAAFAVRLESAEGTLSRHGFRRCDLPACNCGWWHAPEVKR